MEKRIELEKRGRNPSQIEELNLDNCKSASIIGLSDEWTGLKTLSLINVGLTSLKNFPKLTALSKLELSDNWIPGGLESLSELPKLSYLNLSGNKITDIETLSPLKSINTLVNLDLLNCDVTNIENYRPKVFGLIPSLIYLDGFDKDDNEIDEDEDDVDEDGLNNKGGSEDEEDDLGEDEEEDEDEEDDEDEEVPLGAIYNDFDEEGDNDYEEGAGEEDDDDEIEEEEETNVQESDGGKGKKRKLEDPEEPASKKS